MAHRFPQSIVSPATLLSVLTVLSSAMIPVAGQTSLPATNVKGATASKTLAPARTPAGHPDLQGIWSNAIITPLERPPELAGKAVLSAQEAAAYEKEIVKRNNVDVRNDVGTEGDVARAYNNAWYDRGSKGVKTHRLATCRS